MWRVGKLKNSVGIFGKVWFGYVGLGCCDVSLGIGFNCFYHLHIFFVTIVVVFVVVSIDDKRRIQ